MNYVKMYELCQAIEFDRENTRSPALKEFLFPAKLVVALEEFNFYIVNSVKDEDVRIKIPETRVYLVKEKNGFAYPLLATIFEQIYAKTEPVETYQLGIKP